MDEPWLSFGELSNEAKRERVAKAIEFIDQSLPGVYAPIVDSVMSGVNNAEGALRELYQPITRGITRDVKKIIDRTRNLQAITDTLSEGSTIGDVLGERGLTPVPPPIDLINPLDVTANAKLCTYWCDALSPGYDPVKCAKLCVVPDTPPGSKAKCCVGVSIVPLGEIVKPSEQISWYDVDCVNVAQFIDGLLSQGISQSNLIVLDSPCPPILPIDGGGDEVVEKLECPTTVVKCPPPQVNVKCSDPPIIPPCPQPIVNVTVPVPTVIVTCSPKDDKPPIETKAGGIGCTMTVSATIEENEVTNEDGTTTKEKVCVPLPECLSFGTFDSPTFVMQKCYRTLRMRYAKWLNLPGEWGDSVPTVQAMMQPRLRPVSFVIPEWERLPNIISPPRG